MRPTNASMPHPRLPRALQPSIQLRPPKNRQHLSPRGSVLLSVSPQIQTCARYVREQSAIGCLGFRRNYPTPCPSPFNPRYNTQTRLGPILGVVSSTPLADPPYGNRISSRRNCKWNFRDTYRRRGWRGSSHRYATVCTTATGAAPAC